MHEVCHYNWTSFSWLTRSLLWFMYVWTKTTTKNMSLKNNQEYEGTYFFRLFHLLCDYIDVLKIVQEWFPSIVKGEVQDTKALKLLMLVLVVYGLNMSCQRHIPGYLQMLKLDDKQDMLYCFQHCWLKYQPAERDDSKNNLCPNLGSLPRFKPRTLVRDKSQCS